MGLERLVNHQLTLCGQLSDEFPAITSDFTKPSRSSGGHIYRLLSNPIYTGQIAHKGQLYPGQHPALIDAETWTAVQDQFAAKARRHGSKVDAAEPRLLAGMLTDGQGNWFTPSHAARSGRRYRYYVSAAPITETGENGA